jgi:hypothetical protein
MLRYGPDIDYRTQTTSKLCLLSFSQFLYSPLVETSSKLLKSFLSTTADRNEKFSKFVNFSKGSHKIMDLLTSKKEMQKNRYAFLSEFWDRNVIEITQGAIGKNKQKKAHKVPQKVKNKVSSIDDNLKATVISLYFKYSKIRYRIRMLKYMGKLAINLHRNGRP